MADKELRLWVEDQLYALLGEKIERVVSLLRTTRAIAGEGWAAQRAWHCARLRHPTCSLSAPPPTGRLCGAGLGGLLHLACQALQRRGRPGVKLGEPGSCRYAEEHIATCTRLAGAALRRGPFSSTPHRYKHGHHPVQGLPASAETRRFAQDLLSRMPRGGGASAPSAAKAQERAAAAFARQNRQYGLLLDDEDEEAGGAGPGPGSQAGSKPGRAGPGAALPPEMQRGTAAAAGAAGPAPDARGSKSHLRRSKVGQVVKPRSVRRVGGCILHVALPSAQLCLAKEAMASLALWGVRCKAAHALGTHATAGRAGGGRCHRCAPEIAETGVGRGRGGGRCATRGRRVAGARCSMHALVGGQFSRSSCSSSACPNHSLRSSLSFLAPGWQLSYLAAALGPAPSSSCS